MLGKDEKRFLELRTKLSAELEELGKQIDALEWRRDSLMAILDGSFETSPFNEVQEEEEFPPQLSDRKKIDDALVRFISLNRAVKRFEIDEFFDEWNLNSDDIRRALERCKRRGLIQVKGRSKAAVWSAGQ